MAAEEGEVMSGAIIWVILCSRDEGTAYTTSVAALRSIRPTSEELQAIQDAVRRHESTAVIEALPFELDGLCTP